MGAPLAGLRAEDFKVTEDGVQQEVGTFEAVDVSAGTAEVRDDIIAWWCVLKRACHFTPDSRR
jgi:hypothetical protein